MEDDNFMTSELLDTIETGFIVGIPFCIFVGWIFYAVMF
jgi:hypothetical protein